MKLSKDFKEFIELLNENKVEYLLIGGYAVILHGYVRYTGDLDIWVERTPENAKKIIETLQDFGFSDLDLDYFSLTDPDKILQLGNPPFRIDIITSADGVRFEKCRKNAEMVNIDGVRIPVISLKDLKTNKRASGRNKDLDDIEHL